jgi:sigma-B regulation protein RsbU (phosphoserine phosphatase)
MQALHAHRRRSLTVLARTYVIPENRPAPGPDWRHLQVDGSFRSGWQVRAVSIPATEFTGDFYLVSEVDGAVWFAVGDLSGHGLDAAVFTMMVREELDHSIERSRYKCLVELVVRLDAALREALPSNRFVSLVVGRADPDGRVTMVNAGHCHPLVVRRDGAVESVRSGGPVVGIVPGATWSSSSVSLMSGDRLLVHTDGLPEARNEADDEFGQDRIVEFATKSSTESTIETLVGEVSCFAGGRRDDDVTLFLLCRS